MRCIECGSSLEWSNEPVEVEFRGECFTVDGVEHYVCTECGEIVFDAEMNKRYEDAVDEEYRRRNGLLSAQEIKKFRKSIGLSQSEFETLLGAGKTAVCRWETGRLVQSKTIDQLIRAYADCPRLVADAMERAELRGKAPERDPLCAMRVELVSGSAKN